MCAASGTLTIDLGALRENYRYVDSLTPIACETAVSVKADCYGLGMERLAPALYEAGARSFFVATIEEGMSLRALLPEAVIYVLNGFWAQSASEYRSHTLIPVLNSLEDIAALEESKANLPCALHFDTGMNRLGIPQEDVSGVIEHSAKLDIRLVMSHFTSSEIEGHPSTALQGEKFAAIATHFPKSKHSLCNSGGIFTSPMHLDMTRTGIALYGGNPVASKPNPMRPVVRLDAPVLQIHRVQKNETAGYNETYRFSENSTVAVIGAGYADGLFRKLSNSGAVYWKGIALPVRGRVSMDLLICDLCNVPEKDYPKPYDRVEMIGQHQSIDDLARAAGTISYEILTALGRRYTRVYIDKPHVGG